MVGWQLVESCTLGAGLFVRGAHTIGMSRAELNVIQEEEEENYVLTSLLTAAEEGNTSALEELLVSHPDIDLNARNKYGETALHLAVNGGHLETVHFLHAKGFSLVARDKNNDEPAYFAARQGHLEILQYLQRQGISMDRQNKAGESCIHVAVRYGHTDVIKFICQAGANINLQDKQGDTALHMTAWYGLPPEVCQILCSYGSKVNIRNKEEDTPLHCAAARGNLDCLKILLSHGALIDTLDKRGSTALHLSCRRHHIPIAIVLLQAGCQFDVIDQNGETALHPACREGLLAVVQTMCAYGCKVDIISKTGMGPIHLASKHGHTEVVRCLLLSGASVDLQNKDGITAEVMAIAQGQNEVADLLGRLRPDRQEFCIRQLMPSQVPLNRIKVKVFGSSGVGKTTLIDSLKCGYFGSLLRKAGIGNNASNTTTTSSASISKGLIQENGSRHHHSLETQLSFEAVHEGYTHGIDIQQVTISAAGDLSIWEFSGYEPYYMMYDHFIGDPNCIHVVVFSLKDTQDIHLTQLLFWLNFLKARMPPTEPIGYAGRLPCPAKVLLVATHVDKSTIVANSKGEYESSEVGVLLETSRQKFEAELNIYPKIFIVDSHLAMSPEMKALRGVLSDIKHSICQNLPQNSGFLEATVAALPTWRRVLASYPVVTWSSFTEYIRSVVNILASEEHMKEVMCQLQLIGEVVYVETERPDDDLVVLSPRWLCGSVIGQLLAHNGALRLKQTGCFSSEDFQMRFPDCEAEDLLVLLEALQVSTRCDIDGEVEYELPCLNFVETLSGLWDRSDQRLSDDCIYGGVRLVAQRGMTNQLMHVFPRIQVQLRREFLEDHGDAETDLYQWYHGSKYCRGSLEILLTLEQEEQVIEIKCRGPQDFSSKLYHFLEDLCEVVFGVIEDSLPSVSLERHLLSVYQLKAHHNPVLAYIPKDVLLAQMDGKELLTVNCGGKVITEKLIDLVAFGSKEIYVCMKLGLDLHASHLSLNARRQLSGVLDPPDPIGRDWCLLAVSFGLTGELPRVDTQDLKSGSKTNHVLGLWTRNPNATIKLLVQKLLDLGRSDAVDAVLSSAPMFRYFATEVNSTQPPNDSAGSVPNNGNHFEHS